MQTFKDVQSTERFSVEKMQKIALFESRNFFCDVYCLSPGQTQKPHKHLHEDKIYLVLQGSGSVLIEDDERPVQEDDICFAPAGSIHGVRNNSDKGLKLLVFMTPNPNYSQSR